MKKADKRGNVARAYLVFLVIVFALMTIPVFTFADRVEPITLGLPFNLFWIVLVELAAFFAVLGFYLFEHGRGDQA